MVATERNGSVSIWFGIAVVPFPASPIWFHDVTAKVSEIGLLVSF